ncbi:MAG: PARG family protein [Bacteroidaceae bacterium]|nr:PARG family protein [Bacteroidaceae bacterium]
MEDTFNTVNYKKINYEVMTDTMHQYKTIPELQEAIQHSVHRQFMVSHEEDIHQEPASECNTNIVISGKRSFEAAKDYKGKKVAVLNFANNNRIGGAPFSAGAQEESLCRCSTLLPCL